MFFRPILILLCMLTIAGCSGCGGGSASSPAVLSSRSDSLTANSAALSSGSVATIYRFTATKSGSYQIAMSSTTLSCHLLETSQLPFPATQVTDTSFVTGMDGANGQSVVAFSVTTGAHCYLYATTRANVPQFGSYTITYPPDLTLDETITSLQ